MFTTIYYLLALVLILTLHEFAHAWVAYRLGDPTAYRKGRVSLNPLQHIDVLGAIMLFLAGFGWGKPVPVNPQNFKRPMRDQALTALAGPLANLFIAVLVAIPISYLPASFVESGLMAFLQAVLELSLVLFIFNMLPFPPLDGSKFFVLFVPVSQRERYMALLQKMTPFFLIVVVVDLWLLRGILGFSLVWTAVSTATFWLKSALLLVV